MIDRNTPFNNFKGLTYNSSNSAGYRTPPADDYEVDIPVVAEIIIAY